MGKRGKGLPKSNYSLLSIKLFIDLMRQGVSKSEINRIHGISRGALARMQAKYKNKEILTSTDENGDISVYIRDVLLDIVVYHCTIKAGGGLLLFPDLVKEVRMILNVSQEELAQRLSLDRQTITLWETDSHLPTRLALKALYDLCLSNGLPQNLLDSIEMYIRQFDDP